MSLINCPSCQKKISDKSKNCSQCDFSFTDSEDIIQRLKVLKFREYRNKMFRLKMLTFFSISLAVFGTIPMVWNYIKALGYGFYAEISNHWGIYFVMAGFFLFVLLRIVMLITKRNYKAQK